MPSTLLERKESGTVKLKVPMGSSESNCDILKSAGGSGWNNQTPGQDSST